VSGLPHAVRSPAFAAVIGTGGIGAGLFFALAGDHTLGREESRAGRFLDRRDYCKLHIVTHYIKTLLGPDLPVILIGRVGADETGDRLIGEMAEAGLDLRYVERTPGEHTLLSICFLYPDGSGGNLTPDDSACSRVGPTYVARARPEFARFAGRGLALALPEVPLPARQELLRLGTEHGFKRVASFTSGELAQAAESGLLANLDLLALNIDEAATAAGLQAEEHPLEAILEAAIPALRRWNPRLWLSITAGRRGSFAWDGERLAPIPAFPTQVVGTAGAGDALLAGTVVGLAAGLALTPAQELGALLAALAITSPHTIHKEIGWSHLQAFASRLNQPLSDPLQALLASLE
jgi:ribokinase